jgi:mono/diheme cytochrome c family protein
MNSAQALVVGDSMRHLLVAVLLAAPLAARAADEKADGKAVFLENCATCHGENGKADTELGAKYMAADFTSDEWKKEFDQDEAKVKKVIQNGVKDTKMKAWKGILTPPEIDAVAKHVLRLSAGK